MSAQLAFIKTYQQNKITVWIAVFVLVLFIYIYFKGKADGKTNIKDAKYPLNGKSLPLGWNPNVLADKIYKAMDGVLTNTTTKNLVFREVFVLPTDEMLIAVYNTFNDKYGAKGKGSLTEWINDEWAYLATVNYRTKLLERLAELRLT